MTHQTSLTALKFASGFVIVFAALNIASLTTSLSIVMDLFIDFVFLPLDGAQLVDSDAARLWIGISGGLLAGWGLMTWLVTDRVYSRDPAAGRAIILPSILAWFIVDGIGSVAAGAWFNVIVNAAILMMFLIPLLLVRSDRKGAVKA